MIKKYKNILIIGSALAAGIIPLKGFSRVTIDQTKIDHNFIKKMEGSKLQGYVPLAHLSKSGVTIANGVDLGQLNLKEFNNLPISNPLKTKLRPYVGLKQSQAEAFLKKHPLTITTQELEQLNRVAANKILQPLVKSYDKASRVHFIDLPKEAQTVIFSYAYHFGPGFMKQSSSKQLWNYFISQEWSHASSSLKKFKTYSTRRTSEALLLEEIA